MLSNSTGILTESGFIGSGQFPRPYEYIGEEWAQRVHFARNLQRQGKAYYSINTFGDHTNSTTYNRSCAVDPHACITKEVRQWVLGSYLMAKAQGAGIGDCTLPPAGEGRL